MRLKHILLIGSIICFSLSMAQAAQTANKPTQGPPAVAAPQRPPATPPAAGPKPAPKPVPLDEGEQKDLTILLLRRQNLELEVQAVKAQFDVEHARIERAALEAHKLSAADYVLDEKTVALVPRPK